MSDDTPTPPTYMTPLFDELRSLAYDLDTDLRRYRERNSPGRKLAALEQTMFVLAKIGKLAKEVERIQREIDPGTSLSTDVLARLLDLPDDISVDYAIEGTLAVIDIRTP